MIPKFIRQDQTSEFLKHTLNGPFIISIWMSQRVLKVTTSKLHKKSCQIYLLNILWIHSLLSFSTATTLPTLPFSSAWTPTMSFYLVPPHSHDPFHQLITLQPEQYFHPIWSPSCKMFVPGYLRRSWFSLSGTSGENIGGGLHSLTTCNNLRQSRIRSSIGCFLRKCL